MKKKTVSLFRNLHFNIRQSLIRRDRKNKFTPDLIKTLFGIVPFSPGLLWESLCSSVSFKEEFIKDSDSGEKTRVMVPYFRYENLDGSISHSRSRN